jgi:hypothetical protein
MLPKPSHYEGQDERYKGEMVEYNSNAVLISTAPKLLEALQNIVDYWYSPQKGNLSMYDHMNHILEVAEKAIEKATKGIEI